MHMRNKYRNRLDMNKTGGNAIYHQSCQTCNRPALKKWMKSQGQGSQYLEQIVLEMNKHLF